MRKLVLTCFGIASLITATNAQTLFTFGNTPVSKEDFLRVYEKNSINKKPDFSEAALKEYLDLYSLFRMKVKEAELQHLDTLSSIQYELDNYRKQLAKNYLTDDKVINKLIQEAYDRMKEEVHVAHILVMVPQMANGGDTVAAYNKIDSLYSVLSKGKADFATLAKEYSDDRGTRETGGDLGYITALQTIYPFENAAYNTPVGKISKPFRTQFGYHIVKVLDRRPARGEVKVAQILIEVKKSQGEEGLKTAEKRTDSVMAALKKGASFTAMVKKYSDDKFSVNDDGVLAPISVGKVTPEFEEAAFSLKKPGDLAQVRTDYGFHIIKLVEKYPLKPFDSLQPYIKRKVENDSRAQVARDMFYEKMKEKNGFKEYPANFNEVVDALVKIPDTGKYANMFKAADYSNMNKPLFELDKKPYLQSDFISYAEGLTRGRLMGPKNAVLHDIYNMYVKTVVNDIEEHKLVDEYPEFKNLMEEYRDGIMLFELMDRNVWGKASKDTAGLKAFYEQNKSKYQWEPGFTGSVYKFKNEKALKEGMKLLAQKDIKDEDVIKKLNNDSVPDAVTIQRGHYEFSKFKDVPQSAITSAKKVTEPKKNDDGTYTVVRIDEVFTAPTQKTLDEARGYVVAEYQDYLEKTWNARMRVKYPLKVNDKVFASMVK